MASRALSGRLGQLAAPSLLSSASRASRSLANAGRTCRPCASRAVAPLSKRLFATEASQPDATEADTNGVNRVPGSLAYLQKYNRIDDFPRRHIGPDENDTAQMLQALDPAPATLDDFVAQVIPADIRSNKSLQIRSGGSAAAVSEEGLSIRFNTLAAGKAARSFIGAGYYRALTPKVIQRNVLENPAWYTSYTPYQPEISQGRLESLLNFQTMVCDLTALPIANASLLDEGTAAAEAMTMSMNVLPTSRAKRPGKTLVVSDKLHPQTIQVLYGRAEGFGIRILPVSDITGPDGLAQIKELGDDLVGVMVQYPDTYGGVDNFQPLADAVHEQGALLSCATDLLALSVLKPPGEWGADIAFGNAQRFGVPLGFGGPHAAFFAVTEKHKRKIPGRLVGLSRDRLGGKAYRLALQTREQHIRREKATSNVCTSQALLANMSAMYAVYHGPEGLKAIAERAIVGARAVQRIVESRGLKVRRDKSGSDVVLSDTVVVDCGSRQVRDRVLREARKVDFEYRSIGEQELGISIDEAVSKGELHGIASHFYNATRPKDDARVRAGELRSTIAPILEKETAGSLEIPAAFRRTSAFLTHPVFNTHHSETELLRYIHHLQSKDLSLVHSMIPLGSCTMKLNGTTEMSLISDPNLAVLHPYSDPKASVNFRTIFSVLEKHLSEITGMVATSLQPNSGAQGEFAGLRAIREYQKKHGSGDKDRDICLIPVSAHGTNPASAAMAGMRVVPIKCNTETGNLDLEDLEAKCQQYQEELGAIMVTYPSTYGVFEPEIKKVCELVHQYGGQVYMDGANMNAQIGLCSPGEIGADVCHLNLHKTFCIPHGGGGPGVGPICVKKHLKPYLPGNAANPSESEGRPISSAPYGSASINLISWAYTSLMGKYLSPVPR